jgi:hypothetical protein
VNVRAFLVEPLQGKTSLSRVVWLYGVVGSLLYGCIELFLDPENDILLRGYVIGGLLFTLYVIVATYRCAANCQSKFWGRMAKISALLSLLLLPVFAYLELSGALELPL